MRARQRHFNAKDAGASCVYDARYITGLANNDAVSTWSSRTGTNDATQGTAANRPVYKTNQFNGNPVVEFDGTNDRLEFSKLNASAAWALCVVKRKSTNTYQTIFVIQNTAGTNATFAGSVHSDPAYGPVIFGNHQGGFPNWPKGSSVRNDSWRSLYLVWLGGGYNGTTFYNGFDDGVSFALTNSGNIGAIPGATSFIGLDSGSWGGQMAQLVFATTSSTDSIRKRVSHAAAYSFKLASS